MEKVKLNTIEEAIEDFKAGNFVIVVGILTFNVVRSESEVLKWLASAGAHKSPTKTKEEM